MNFFDRYSNLCKEKNMDPCSQNTADLIGVSKATISVWKNKNTVPKGDTISTIADILGVSADYLLGRTNRNSPPDYNKLDGPDQLRVDAYIEGLLENPKYR